jgi:hypothetical protein
VRWQCDIRAIPLRTDEDLQTASINQEIFRAKSAQRLHSPQAQSFDL